MYQFSRFSQKLIKNSETRKYNSLVVTSKKKYTKTILLAKHIIYLKYTLYTYYFIIFI